MCVIDLARIIGSEIFPTDFYPGESHPDTSFKIFANSHHSFTFSLTNPKQYSTMFKHLIQAEERRVRHGHRDDRVGGHALESHVPSLGCNDSHLQ
eukprot:SAG11_NODE_15736_length_567_cov_14.025641_1_plen_94_part_10